jgi:hypothetical protein
LSFHGRLALALAESGDLMIILKFKPNAIWRVLILECCLTS